ncbi:MAG: nucleotidyltransferase [Bdellovibrionota bacterium]
MDKTLTPDKKFIKVLGLLDNYLSSLNYEYCLVGGLAVQVRGRPRFTHDIDLCILTSLSDQEALISNFSQEFELRFEGADDLARSSQILPLLVEGIEVDISLGLSLFEEGVVKTASLEQITPDLCLPVCSAEDLIVFKIIAGRPKDIEDIKSIIAYSSDALDREKITKNLRLFETALAEDGLLERFKELT